jgi:hypothetical protein
MPRRDGTIRLLAMPKSQIATRTSPILLMPGAKRAGYKPKRHAKAQLSWHRNCFKP